MNKILYFSDNYAFHVMGTKRSIAGEIKNRGYDLIFVDKKKINNKILNLIKIHDPDQIWLAHSGLIISENIKNQIKQPVVGFGFSDPYYFSAEKRFGSYDAYITNNYGIYEKYKNTMLIFYNPTACDFSFHKKIILEKDIDVSLIGGKKIPHFKNKFLRRDFIKKLKDDTNFKIETYGKGWGNYASGDNFLQVINRSKIGLDIQDDFSPLAHRMFEYSSCGTPVITKRRKEVFIHMQEDKEILAYDNYDEMKEKLIYYLNNEEKLEKIGEAAMARCKREHDIKYRVDGILQFLSKNLK